MYPHKITFEKIQELKKLKTWLWDNFPKEIAAYNEKMGNPNAFNELMSLSMSKEVMIFGGKNRGGYKLSTMKITSQQELRALILKHNRLHPLDKITLQEHYEQKSSKYGYPSYGTLVKYIGAIDWKYATGKTRTMLSQEELRARPTKVVIKSEKELRKFILAHNKDKTKKPIHNKEDWGKVSKMYGYMSLKALEKRVRLIDWEFVTGKTNARTKIFVEKKTNSKIDIQLEDQLRELILQHNKGRKVNRIESRRDYIRIYKRYGFPEITYVAHKIGGPIDWNYVTGKKSVSKGLV